MELYYTITRATCFVILVYISLVAGSEADTSKNSSEAIKCFQCNSAEHIECADLTVNDTSSPFFQECFDYPKNGQYTPFCRKVKDTINAGKDHQETRIVRSCGWILDKNDNRTDVCKKGDTDFILRTSCTCFSDACNEGSTFSRSLGVSSLIVSMIAFKILV